MMKAKSCEMDGQIVTEDEAALYDRQIRLWGLPAQKRLRASRVLVAGLKGLGAEISKNIVLAGIKSLTILDHTQVDTEDCFSQFFINKSDIGSNRATCSLPKIQQLNPTVEVIADTSDVKDKEESFFLQFDIVCLTNCLVNTAISINEICRKNEIKFMLGTVHGMFGYFFNDFGKHEFQMESSNSSNENQKCTPPKQSKIEGNLETKIISYVSLKQALSSEIVLPTTKKRNSKLTNSFAIMKALNEFNNKYGRNPSIITMESDSQLLNDIFVSYLKSKFDERLSRACISEISPVCAIVGGVFAQEIIKALSRTDGTFQNFFFFNGLNGTGVVESYGS